MTNGRKAVRDLVKVERVQPGLLKSVSVRSPREYGFSEDEASPVIEKMLESFSKVNPLDAVSQIMSSRLNLQLKT